MVRPLPRHLPIPLLLLLLVLPTASPAQDRGADVPGAIEGRILRADGTPASGVRISLIQVDAARGEPATHLGEVEVGSDASFRLEPVDPGVHVIMARLVEADRRIVRGAVVRVPGPGQTAELELSFPRPSTLELEIPGAPDGSFLFILPDPRTEAGGRDEARTARVLPGNSPLRFYPNGAPPYPVSPTTVLGNTENVTSVRVEGGRATAEGLAPGTYDVSCVRADPGRRTWSCRTVEVEPGRNRVEIPRIPPARLRVEVTGDRVEDASVILRPLERRTLLWHQEWYGERGVEVPPSGSLDLERIPPGRYLLAAATATGEASRFREIELGEGETRTAQLRLRPSRRVAVDVGPNPDEELLSYEVLGTWFPGVPERVRRLPLRVRLPADAETLVIWEGTRRVAVVDATTEGDTLHARLDPPARLSGIVRDARGEPAGAGVEVELVRQEEAVLPFRISQGAEACANGVIARLLALPERGDPRYVETDAAGRFGPVPLSPGRWVVRIPGGGQRELTLTSGESTDLRLDLSR